MTSYPPSITLKASRIDAAQGELMDTELALLEGATAARQKEIIAGRVLARHAIGEMGYPHGQIMQRPSGAPEWPIGICGSITHSAIHVAVALAPISQMRSVGIDIDDGRNLGNALSRIGQYDEIRGLITHPLVMNEEDAARMLFSAKEALFKCQSAITDDTDLDFLQVRIELSAGGILTAIPVLGLDQRIAISVAEAKIVLDNVQGLTVALAWVER